MTSSQTQYVFLFFKIWMVYTEILCFINDAGVYNKVRFLGCF